MPIRARSHYLLSLVWIGFRLVPNQQAAQTSAQGNAAVQLTATEMVQKLVGWNAKRAKASEAIGAGAYTDSITWASRESACHNDCGCEIHSTA